MYTLNRLAVWRSCELCAPVGDKQPAWPHHFTSWVEMFTYVVMCVYSLWLRVYYSWYYNMGGVGGESSGNPCLVAHHCSSIHKAYSTNQCLGNMWWNSGHFSRADSASACYSHIYHLPTAPREALILFESKRLNQINGCMNKPMI